MPDFDPYLKWLGIRDPQRPPNHYRLVGVELFEQDTEVIAAAADRQMAHVRSFQNGPEAELSQRLLSEIAIARRCLMSNAKRQNYEAELRKVLDAEQTVEASITPAIQTVAISTSKSLKIKPTRHRPTSRKINLVPLLITATATGLLIVGGGIAAVVMLSGGTNDLTRLDKKKSKVGVQKHSKADSESKISQPNVAGNKKVKGKSSKVAKVKKNIPPKIDKSSRGVGRSKPPWKSIAEYAAEPPVELSREDSEIAKRLQPVYYAVSVRNIQAAEAILGNILNDPKYHGSTDELPGVRECVELVSNHKRFWKRYEFALAALNTGMKILYRGRLVEVVSNDVDRKKMNLKDANGETQIHSTAFHEVYRDLAIGIVQKSLPNSDSTPQYVAAFRKFDFVHRQRLLGIKFDLKKALADSKKTSPGTAPMDDVSENPNPQIPESKLKDVTSRKKSELPGPAERAAALRKVKNVYAEEYKLKKVDQRLEFANTLMVDAADDELDAASRWAMLNEARKIYVTLGKIQLMMDAIDKLEEYFLLRNYFEFAEESLDEVSRKLASAKDQQRLVQQWTSLWNRALAEEKYSEALMLIGKTSAALKKLGDATSFQKLQSVKKDVSEMKRLAVAADNALKTLAQDETDTQANLALGKYMCFVKNDFQTGLPMLAKGSDARLKKAAQLEIEVESQDLRDKQIEVARSWYDLSAGKMLQHKRIKLHAAKWFRTAGKKLTGLDKREVEKILKEIELVEQDFDAANVSAFGRFRFLADNRWEIDWRGFEKWNDVQFHSDGRVSFMIKNDKQTVPWRVSARGIEIVRGRFLAVVVPRQNGTRLEGRHYVIANGKDRGGVIGKIKKD